MDNVTLNNRTYKLPKKTLDIVSQIEALMDIEMRYEKRLVPAIDCLTAEYNFLVEIMGADKAAEVLGTDNLSDADTNEISIAVMRILSAYSEKVEKARLERQMQVFNDPKMKQAIDLVRTAHKVNAPTA